MCICVSKFVCVYLPPGVIHTWSEIPPQLCGILHSWWFCTKLLSYISNWLRKLVVVVLVVVSLLRFLTSFKMNNRLFILLGLGLFLALSAKIHSQTNQYSTFIRSSKRMWSMQISMWWANLFRFPVFNIGFSFLYMAYACGCTQWKVDDF